MPRLEPLHLRIFGITMIAKDSLLLLVDDSMAMRQTIKNVLTDEGFKNIHTASDGKEAMARIKGAMENDQMYNIIFLDWHMPEMDGLEFLKTCRNEMGLKKVAIIMLTAVSDQKSVITALNSGATSYITKPVSAKTLLTKIEQVSEWLEKGKKP